MDLSFLSLKDIYGANHIYHLRSAISKKACESIKYGYCVAYIFDGEECRIYDNNKINHVKTKSVLKDEEFQKIFKQLATFTNLTRPKLQL